MAVTEIPCYTLINVPSDFESPNEMQLKRDLEKGDVKAKTEALKKTIYMILNGEKIQGILMTIIRFVLPSQDHTIKKLLLIFWEIVPKTHPDGKLLQEMILVCDAYRKDLQHPNEFIRGSTLRFLCKLKEPELLEPLMPTITSCLEHRHSYVRRNAVLAIFIIYKNFDFLIPDAPLLIANFLEGEHDMSCKRNAFIMLIYADQDRALNYLSTCIDQVHSFGDILQLVIVELIYKVCVTVPSERSRFIRCIYNMLSSNSSSVRYEAAGTLMTLSSASAAIKAAATCYIELIVKESDNNVKLIVLDQLISMKESSNHEKVVQGLVMDILRILNTPDLEVRRKTLTLCMDLVSSRNIEQMVGLLKKEVSKTRNALEHEDYGKYRQLLVRTLHSCCIKFPDVADAVIVLLMDFLSDTNELAALDVLIFIREAVTKFEKLRNVIIEKLLETFMSITSSQIHRAALWILGEFCNSADDIQAVMNEVRQSLGEIPLVEDEIRKAGGSEQMVDESVTSLTNVSQQLVTADGIYATQSIYTGCQVADKDVAKSNIENRPPLRRYLMEGDFFIGAAIATSLTKLTIRYRNLMSRKENEYKCNHMTAETMLVLTSILRLGESSLPSKKITADDSERINFCLKVLLEPNNDVDSIFETECRSALSDMIEAQGVLCEDAHQNDEIKSRLAKKKVEPDTRIQFSQLDKKSDMESGGDIFEIGLNRALGSSKKAKIDFSSSKLSKVTQLTGFSDPVYAEAYVNVNQFDIVLDVLIVNQTSDTLQNCTLELATLGDLRLVERPPSIILPPNDFCTIKANVKVASTENGIIFGNIVYDCFGAVSDRNVVVLNDIHVDIMDYIIPASCTHSDFRRMWAEFEWENKVSVNTTISDLGEYLESLLKCTNMRSLTPAKAMSGQCGFMAANLYAKSVFGEDALANVSLEKNLAKPDAPVTGHIRVRAKSQGMALSLGDKINVSQKTRSKKFTVASQG